MKKRNNVMWVSSTVDLVRAQPMYQMKIDALLIGAFFTLKFEFELFFLFN